jgi:hypothetical protein
MDKLTIEFVELVKECDVIIAFPVHLISPVVDPSGKNIISFATGVKSSVHIAT